MGDHFVVRARWAILAALIGLFSLRVQAIFFAMITLAVASAFLVLASQMSWLTGGDDGGLEALALASLEGGFGAERGGGEAEAQRRSLFDLDLSLLPDDALIGEVDHGWAAARTTPSTILAAAGGGASVWGIGCASGSRAPRRVAATPASR